MPGRVTVQPVTVPEPGPQDVVVRVTHSWISNGTEGSFVRGERIAGDTARGPDDPLPFPHVPGYQKVGVIEWAGSEAGDWKVGETVFATVSRIDGMFFDYAGHVSPAVTHRSQLWRLPESLDPVAASGLVLTQVGFNVGSRPPVGSGDAAVVIGDGLVGQWSAQTLAQRGARVLLLGRHDDRLARFVRGETARVATPDHARAAVRAFAGENATAIVADTVGERATIEALLPTLRHNGHIVSAGFFGHDGRIDIQALRSRELTLHAPAGWNRARMDATLALLADGALATLPLITHRFPVARAAEAYSAILEKQNGVLGVVLDWEAV